MPALDRFSLPFFTLIIVLWISVPLSAQSILPNDMICGKWMSTQKNLAVQVYKSGSVFKAKIIWFNDTDDKTRPMSIRDDSLNPDEKLRHRLILGMEVLTGLIYQAETNSWEQGVIYDAKHGRYWDSAGYITKDGLLKVTGYWHFKWIGKTLTFKRM